MEKKIPTAQTTTENILLISILKFLLSLLRPIRTIY
jgi:hypothetical protein